MNLLFGECGEGTLVQPQSVELRNEASNQLVISNKLPKHFVQIGNLVEDNGPAVCISLPHTSTTVETDEPTTTKSRIIQYTDGRIIELN